MTRFHGRRGFTLIELLVVIAIMAVLTGILLPAVQKAREAVNRASCMNNLKQMGLACQTYHDAFGHLPPGYLATQPYADGTTDTSPGWGWAAHLLPYLEQEPLFRQIDFNQPVTAAPAVVQARLKVYLCPSDVPSAGPFAVPDAFGAPMIPAAPCSYAACTGGDESDVTGATGQGVFYRNSQTRLAEILDGTSSTILIGDKAWGNVNIVWCGVIPGAVAHRGALNRNPGSDDASLPAPALILSHSHLNNATTDTDAGLDDFSSFHINGSNFLFADGSVHFLRSIPGDNADGGYTPESVAFQALGTRAGGEVIQGLDY